MYVCDVDDNDRDIKIRVIKSQEAFGDLPKRSQCLCIMLFQYEALPTVQVKQGDVHNFHQPGHWLSPLACLSGKQSYGP